jgi:hypothetical protein
MFDRAVRRLLCTQKHDNREIIDVLNFNYKTKLKLNSVALVRERTIPTERPPPVGEVSANFCG